MALHSKKCSLWVVISLICALKLWITWINLVHNFIKEVHSVSELVCHKKNTSWTSYCIYNTLSLCLDHVSNLLSYPVKHCEIIAQLYSSLLIYKTFFRHLTKSDKLFIFLRCCLIFSFSFFVSIFCFWIKSFNSAFDYKKLTFYEKKNRPSFTVLSSIYGVFILYSIYGVFIFNCLRSVTSFCKYWMKSKRAVQMMDNNPMKWNDPTNSGMFCRYEILSSYFHQPFLKQSSFFHRNGWNRGLLFY